MKRTKATWFVTGFLTGFLMFIAASESEAGGLPPNVQAQLDARGLPRTAAVEMFKELGETCEQAGHMDLMIDDERNVWITLYATNVTGINEGELCEGPCKLVEDLVLDETQELGAVYVSVTMEGPMPAFPSGACSCGPPMDWNDTLFAFSDDQGWGALCGGFSCSESGKLIFATNYSNEAFENIVKNWFTNSSYAENPLTFYLGQLEDDCEVLEFSTCDEPDWCNWGNVFISTFHPLYPEPYYPPVWVTWYGQMTHVDDPPEGCDPECEKPGQTTSVKQQTWGQTKNLFR